MIPADKKDQATGETPSERAMRACEQLRGLLKEEIAAHGGAEGFIRWVRSRDEETEVDVWLRRRAEGS